MRDWRTLGTQIGVGLTFMWRRRARLREAYHAVFRGKPSSEDQEIVLADLLAMSGFSRFWHRSVTNDELRYQEGMRALYGRIHDHLSLGDEDIEHLETAVRHETAQHEEYRQ